MYYVVFVTAPPDEAYRIAKILVEEKLAACINMLNVNSMYWWKGKVEEDKEVLLIIKTKEEILDQLINRVKEIHPYEVPEIISLRIEKGNRDYLNWISESVGLE